MEEKGLIKADGALTDKQQKWLDEYLEHGNGDIATKRAYGLTGQSCWNQTLLNKKKFNKVIEKVREEKRSEFYGKVVSELGKSVEVAVGVRDDPEAKPGERLMAASKIVEWSGEGQKQSKVTITHQFQRLFDEVGFGDSEVVEASLVKEGS